MESKKYPIGGYAPGNYHCTCCVCGNKFSGDKRAVECEPCASGCKWVKCFDRLPGYKKRVKWRDGNNHSYATDGEISIFEMEKPNLDGWEWLDESAAGREEDACDFAEWMRLNCKSSQHGWVDALGKWDTTKGWYELFKQQNIKV